MTMNSDLLCMEDSAHYVSRWFRIARHNQQLYVIESPNYADTDHAYLMQFTNQDDFDHWLDQQKQDGWEITYTDEHNFKRFDPTILEQIKTNVFRVLRTK